MGSKEAFPDSLHSLAESYISQGLAWENEALLQSEVARLKALPLPKRKYDAQIILRLAALNVGLGLADTDS